MTIQELIDIQDSLMNKIGQMPDPNDFTNFAYNKVKLAIATHWLRAEKDRLKLSYTQSVQHEIHVLTMPTKWPDWKTIKGKAVNQSKIEAELKYVKQEEQYKEAERNHKLAETLMSAYKDFLDAAKYEHKCSLSESITHAQHWWDDSLPF